MAEAVALYDYNAQEHDELTLQKGDVITDIIIQPGGWWEGKLKGKKSMFPDNFVMLKVADGEKSVNPEVTNRLGSGRKCKVLFSYHPENTDELKLKVNDIIEILDEVEEGWWKGKLRDEVGVFPSNFVSEISDEKLESETESSEMKKSKPTQVESLKTNETATNHKDASLPWSRSTSVSTDSKVPLLPPKPVKEVCKVIFPYKAANEDELTLKEGDIITILSKEVPDKGWWKGELNGQVGMVPDNFVQLLPIDESSKPARPPVKGATTNRTRDSLTNPTTLSSSSTSLTELQPSANSTHLPEAPEPPVKNETQDEEKKKYLRSKMDSYMRRAETLNKRHNKHHYKKHINDKKSKGTYHEVLQIENDSTGHSYDSVFGRFLNKDVTSIAVQDPYVRAFHQCQNFLQACELFVKKCENLKQINLLTGEDSSDSQKQWLEQLRESLLSKHNICLNVKYSSTLHDRQILLNNGWIIKIGRGLDYFKAVDNKFCIGSHDYDLRPCFETNVDIFHKKNVQFKNSN